VQGSSSENAGRRLQASEYDIGLGVALIGILGCLTLFSWLVYSYTKGNNKGLMRYVVIVVTGTFVIAATVLTTADIKPEGEEYKNRDYQGAGCGEVWSNISVCWEREGEVSGDDQVPSVISRGGPP